MIKLALLLLAVAAGIVLAWWLLCFFKYRLLKRPAVVVIQGVVTYRISDLSWSNRQRFESLMGGRKLVLEGQGPFFVASRDYAKWHPEGPLALAKKKVAMSVTLEVHPLLLGGWSRARLVFAEQINQPPTLLK
ncbi:hypothetical protein [Gallaecimonas xiamenensis]|uniref:Uncharacterized protein n=1 Tax=Gallaecimonas xiamenensis 3-C-1 TaxID=745411 RepID=K2J2W8_9GAMM|nr:hypothetical protein [Gallaecimonas xiamenensis]EKE69458.1 hypothetical protein B3C1_15142 [Gallaecimonas xiamenensis 3-C-1]